MNPGLWHPRLATFLTLLVVATTGGDSGKPPVALSPAISSAAETDLARLEAEARRAFDESFHAKAEAAARQLREKTEAIYGSHSIQTADALDLLVQCCTFGPSRREAETRRLAESTVELRQGLHSDRDARYARSLCNQAVLLQQTGAGEVAVPLFEKALQITESDLGPNHPQVATILNGYGEYLRGGEEGARALTFFGRALAILEATSHPDTLEFTTIMNRMALVYWDTAEYSSALRYFNRALALREARYGKDHPRVLGILNNKGHLLKDMGDRAAALETYKRVLIGLRHTLDDPDDPRIAVAILSIAAITRLSDPGHAQQLYEEALAATRRRQGEEHELVPKCLLGLALSHRDLGQFDAAISRLQEALAVGSRVFGPEHWWFAFALRHLAALHYDLGELETSRDECQRALSIAEKALDPSNPELAEILAVLGPVRAALGDTTTAVETCLRAAEIARAHLQLTARGFSDREALQYAAVCPRGLDVPLQTAEKGADPARSRRIWDALVRSRALVLEEMASRSRIAALSSDPETARLVADVRRASTRLANLLVAGPAAAPERDAEAVAAAREEKDAADRTLAARNASFRHDLDRDQIGLDAVESALPAGSALVAFAEFEVPTPSDPSVPRREREAAPSRVLAFVLDPRRQIQVVPIGAKGEVEAAVQAWIREAARRPSDSEKPTLPAAHMARGEALRRLAWDPIEPALGGARLVFLVPEGSLHKVNFAALPTSTGSFLAETDRRLHLLGAERDLVSTGADSSRGEGLLVFGGADFDAPLEDARIASRNAPSSVLSNTAPSPTATRQIVPMPPCGGLEGVRFTPLPGSLREATLVAANWTRWQSATSRSKSKRASQVTLFTGADATEDALKTLAPHKQNLHLATHGFVLASGCPAAASGTRGIRPALPPGTEAATNPLQLAGLAFACVNHRDLAPDDQDDGILTAEEAACLNLQGVDWVVLSGCDTGVGQVQTGEGILGLRRAFQIAGARSLIMSLWAVSDDAACDWMEALYLARYRDGLGTADAVHAATQRVIETRRRNGQSVHPFYWAGFVAAGDWR